MSDHGRQALVQFAVAYVKDIEWDDTCLDRLALPSATTKVIQPLCKAHLARDSDLSFEDFVAGKGHGLITLLQCALDTENLITCSNFYRRRLRFFLGSISFPPERPLTIRPH